MKKIIAAILAVIMCIVFITGCDSSTVEAKTIARFEAKAELIDLRGDIYTITDKETGVMYLFYDSENYAGGLTVMVDENGKPLISDEYSGE